VEEAELHMKNTKETLMILKENLQMAQNMMNQQAYQHQRKDNLRRVNGYS
jgi:hypothetical protein